MCRTPLLLVTLLALIAFVSPAPAADAPRPNILWITSEDNGPALGCYGDAYAQTPNLDRLAARGMIYLNAWSNAPVCAPARTAIITGVYPTATGSEHMRSSVPMSATLRMYPQVLREAGYYCTNNVKEDYNLQKPAKVWDESSNKAHYRNRPAGAPFFAVFNIQTTHESQIRKPGHVLKHDPAKAPLPPYHPDAPEVRAGWAQYYDKMSEMDAEAGARLQELADAGLADDTIVFYYGDHGCGLPRGKRFAANAGLRVPLIVHVPEKFKHLAPPGYAPGGKTDRLVSFVDLAPTLFSLAGTKVPEWVQGHAFMGPSAAPEQPYVYGFRGRMDERPDLCRSVRDKRYVYLRNYMPHRPHGQHNAYMFQTPTTQVWKRLFDEGKLNAVQSDFWQPKAPEELYDLESDPWEVHNLAASPEHKAVLERMRGALRAWVLRTRDVGFLPEGDIHDRSKGSTPYDVARDDSKYPLERILAAAELASSLSPDATAELKALLRDRDVAVRYWAATGLLARGRPAVESSRAELAAALADESPYVRIPAAEALGRHGTDAGAAKARPVLLALAAVDRHGNYVAVAALNAIDALGDRADPIRADVKKLPRTAPGIPPTMREYVPRLVEHHHGGGGVKHRRAFAREPEIRSGKHRG